MINTFYSRITFVESYNELSIDFHFSRILSAQSVWYVLDTAWSFFEIWLIIIYDWILQTLLIKSFGQLKDCDKIAILKDSKDLFSKILFALTSYGISNVEIFFFPSEVSISHK